jgi:hypothetical protein
MMKYLEVNREIIDGEDGVSSANSSAIVSSGARKEHRRRQDDEVYDEVWHIKFKHRRRAVDRAARSNVKSFGSCWQLADVPDRQTVHAQTSTRGSATEDHRGPTQGYTLGIARRIKRRHVGILHQNLADAGIVCNKSQRDKNPSYLDFHEHVILEGYALPETRTSC